MENSSGPGVLVQKINHATGKLQWKMMPEDYDYSQELARAAFADMLHDSERNKLYREGLKAAIKKVRERGDKVRVLDIGTGTGLLSMMAAVEGVDSIVACEEFRPMAECAARVIEENGFKDQIKLVRKRSTELTVGPGCDLEERANILVTEVFDTELIGEGAIGTYNHANKELLTEDRLVVPGIARMYAQAVSSKKASGWSRLHSINLDNGDKLRIDDVHTIDNLVLHDLQLSEVDTTLFTPLSPPVKVFDFDLACRERPIPDCDESVTAFNALNGGVCTAVFMWWDCFTDPDNTVLLSCAPRWSHHDPKNMPWRDHWMQAVYYPREEIEVKRGQQVYLKAMHDEYSLSFDVTQESKKNSGDNLSPVYLPMSRTRLGEVNDSERTVKFVQSVSQLIEKDSVSNVICFGDQSLLGLVLAKLSVNRVTVVQENNKMNEILRNIAEKNCLTSKLEFVQSPEEVIEHVDLVVGDPFYSVSVLPWHNLLLWYQIQQLRERSIITDNSHILPGSFSIWAVPVHYKDLWKIRADLGTIEGFSMRHFDDIIDKASENCDNNVEPQPLWEYPCNALGKPAKVANFDLNKKIPTEKCVFEGDVAVENTEQDLNGLALWGEWTLAPGVCVSSGPVSDVRCGEKIQWTMDSKQGVHFFKAPHAPTQRVHFTATFDPEEGDFEFKFTR